MTPGLVSRSTWLVFFPLLVAGVCHSGLGHAQTARQAGIEPAAVDLGPTERMLALLGGALSVIPGSVGVDIPLSSFRADGIRGLIAWPFQIPLRPGRYRTRTATFTNHRILIEGALAVGPQTGLTPTEITLVTFEPRVGYRLVIHPRSDAAGFFLGLNHAVQFWPWVRPSISPEVGLHLGECCGDATAVFNFTVRADFYPVGTDAVRLAMLLGWSFY